MASTDPLPDTLDALEAVIRSRRGGDPNASYVARLFDQGRAKIAQKVGEEAVEAAIAAVQGERAALKGEAADLLFHLIVLLVDSGLRLDDVRAELARREGLSGLAEKAARADAPSVVAAAPPAPKAPPDEPPSAGSRPLSVQGDPDSVSLRPVPPPEPGRPRPLPAAAKDY